MPTRYLKPGIRDSEPIDSLTPQAECLFYRLIVTVDDFGRCDARPAMIKANCYPIKAGITADHCAAMLAELHRAGLVIVYTVDGKPYLQLCKWDNTPRSKASKFPAPADNCTHMHTDACKQNENESSTAHTCAQVHTDARNPRTVLPVTETETGTETENRNRGGSAKRAARKCPADFALTDDLREWAVENAPDVDPDKATAAFKDHTFKTAIVDWPGAWRNWLRRDQEFADSRKPRRPAAGPGESFRERDARIASDRVSQLIGRAPSAFDDVIDVDAVSGDTLPLIEGNP